MAANAPTPDRYGRHVRQARLSLPRGAPARKLAFAMEESLRLASLPGENEGRAYYFQRLRLTGLPLDGDRRTWLDKFQRLLLESAAQAVHAMDVRASHAPAVYFHGAAEPLEILLHRAIARQPAEEWFWPLVIGAAPSHSFSAAGWASPDSKAPSPWVAAALASSASPAGAGAPSIPQLIELLRECEASWVAVAMALFSRPQFDAVRLLGAIPPAAARQWLAEMDTASGPEPRQRQASLSFAAQPAIDRALRAFGGQKREPDARLVWLIVMALLIESPGELALGTAVRRARQVLAQIAADMQPPETSLARAMPATHATPAPRPEPALEPSRGQAPAPAARPHPGMPVPLSGHAGALSEASPAARRFLGERTNGGGLFFLLHALRRLGIEQAQRQAPQLSVHVLYRLALQVGLAAEDPVRAWLESVTGEPTRREPLVRVWSMAVHRLVRQFPAAPALTVRDIAVREAIFSVNRTELDVSLPLDAADIRIRLAGLDLDPGWLPWFGRVVRFHYLHRGEFRA